MRALYAQISASASSVPPLWENAWLCVVIRCGLSPHAHMRSVENAPPNAGRTELFGRFPSRNALSPLGVFPAKPDHSRVRPVLELPCLNYRECQ